MDNRYDIIVIGSGPGGYVAAIRAAQCGKRVAIVEKADAGGVCLNWGCIPTKALVRSAQVYADCKAAATFGVAIEGEVKPDWTKMVERERMVASTMNKGVQFLLKKNNIDVIAGFGRLKASDTVEVEGVDYEADNIILATGARPRVMPFMPVDGKHIISSKEALVLPELPESMVVVGSGAIGSEFAYIYATLGVKVTIIEYMPQIMPLEDEDTAKAMERAFRKLRATVMTSTTVKQVTVNEEGKCIIDIEGKKGAQTIEADIVLSAVGIKSNIEELNLDKVGVQVERDKIVVDNDFRTSVSSIFAVGDIIASPALAHIASAEATNCVERMFGKNPSAIDYTLTPACIFTTPEIASVGLTEEQVQKQGIEYKVARYNFASSGKAAAAGDRDGFVKLIFDAENKLRGAHIIGANVVEMLGEPSVAMAMGATAEDLARTIHAHPSLYEGIYEAAKSLE